MLDNDLCLIYPPLSVHEFPHMAMPLLKGFIKKNGYEKTVVKDFNVGIMDDIISSRLYKVENYFDKSSIKISASDIDKNIKLAKRILSEESERGKDEWAFKIINTYLGIAGSNISEVCFSPLTFKDIKETYVKEDNNLYTDVVIRKLYSESEKYFENNKSKVVAITIPFASQLFYALILGRKIKRQFPDVKVVFGGAQVSMFWKLIIEHEEFRKSFDALIYGNGELGLLGYLEHVIYGKTIENIPNLIYVNGSGEICKNPEKNIKHINEMPVPDFEDLPIDKYAYPKLPYMMTRGCYWGKCAFCSYRETKGYMMKDVDTIVNDIITIKKKYNRRLFHFIDDAIHPSLLDKVSRILIDENIKIKYETYLRFDRNFDEELCKRLSKSGLRSALFGLESANLRIIKLMNKGINLDDVRYVLNNMTKADIKPVISCLIGFPTETKDEAMESIKFLVDNKSCYQQAFLVHYGLISDMYNCMSEYGLKSVDLSNPIRYDDSGYMALGYKYETSCGMSIEEALKVIKEGRKQLGIRLFEDSFFS